MKIARVFPVKTSATPVDELVFVDCGPGFFPIDVDEVHISVVFTWHRRRAEELAKEWESVAPVKIGGPGWSDTPGGEFNPGVYLRPGLTITSRGCPNRCWFCSVWKREPGLRELSIKPGWNILDDNLLACSERHISSVFRMLSGQRRRAHFTGGLEAKLLQPWHISWFQELNPAALFFAYDTPDDYEPLLQAGRRLTLAGLTRNQLYCYVLIGQPRDSFSDAEYRLRRAWSAGFIPFAMLWRDKDGKRDHSWMRFSRPWSRPAATKAMCAKEN